MESGDRSTEQSRDGAALACCLAAVACPVLVTALAVVAVVWLVRIEAPGSLIALAGGGSVLLGLLAGIILWAVGRMIVRQRRILQQLARGRPDSSPTPSAEVEPVEKALVDRLDEIRDVLLMTERQRDLRRMHVQAEQAEMLTQRFETAMQRGDFDAAGDVVDQLAQSQPDHHRLAALKERLAEATRTARKTDLQSARQQVQELLSAGRYDDARRRAGQIRDKYPDEPLGPQLLEQIEMERRRAEREKIEAMYLQVDRLAENRQWAQAVEQAKTFLETWPESSEADLVRATLPTLEDNARLARVRDLRDRIRELIGRKQYAEALELARTVVREYPETAAAKELSDQMDRLAQRAARQGKQR